MEIKLIIMIKSSRIFLHSPKKFIRLKVSNILIFIECWVLKNILKFILENLFVFYYKFSYENK